MAEVTGPIGSHWRSLGGENGPLGAPISDNTRLARGEIAFFKYGYLWTGEGSTQVLYGDIDMPLLGNPLLLPISQERPAILRVLTRRHRVAGLPTQHEPTAADVGILRGAIGERLFLKPIGRRASDSTLIPLSVLRQSVDGLRFGLRGSETGRLRGRQLYDIVLRLPNGRTHALSAHAVYVTDTNWRDFSFIHATDIHVARRIDGMHGRLKRAVRERKLSRATLDSFENWNDNFGDFIRYANQLHADNRLDFILATGDLVDYLFERGTRNRALGGNFALFKSMIQGRGRFSDGSPREELQVPIFTTLGNHDYRTNPYRLLSRVVLTITDTIKGVLDKVPLVGNIVGDLLGGALNFLGIGRVGSSKISFEDERFGDYNLTEQEAKLLEGGSRPNLSTESAAKMVMIDKPMRRRMHYYFREISRTGSYIIPLGERHRIVMVDTKYDSGFTTDLVDVLLAKYIGFGSSETKRFTRGFINSEGFGRSENSLVERALREASGLVIVGMHAPPICHAGSEFSHFFRETEHRSAPIADTIDFLLRQGGIPPFKTPLTETTVASLLPGRKFNIRQIEPDQIRGWRVDRTSFFRQAKKRDDASAKGVADHADTFLDLCTGGGRGSRGGRKVNLVLSGHKHKNVQYRLGRPRGSDEIRYMMDFYTENPTRYYDSREFAAGDKSVAVRVKSDATTVGPLQRVRDHRGGRKAEYFRRDIPPFSNTLDAASDAAAWWRTRSPLIMITPSLGPIDKNQRLENHPDDGLEPAFQGVRRFEVRNDVIRSAEMVTIDEIRQQAPRADVVGGAPPPRGDGAPRPRGDGPPRPRGNTPPRGSGPPRPRS